MTSKFTSLADIIERVYRGTGIDVIPWADAAEDVLDCLRLIGVPQSYLDKTTNGQQDNPVPIIVSNYRGELPFDLAVPGSCRLIHLDSTYNISSFTMMVESTDLFYQSPTVAEQFATDVNAFSSASTLVATSLELKMDEAQDHIDSGDLADATTDLEDVIADVRQAQGRIVSSSSKNLDFIPKYKLNNNYIFTNFKNGFVEMAYKALPVDDAGMPMVPDDIRFVEAVRWFLTERIDYKRWRATRNPNDEKMYLNSSRECSWYMASARSKGFSPTVDKMESIKRMILRSIPKINEFKTGFKNSTITEQRKF
jgi:hypothetical protein